MHLKTFYKHSVKTGFKTSLSKTFLEILNSVCEPQTSSELSRTYQRWAEAAPGMCVVAASVTSSEPSLRGNKPTGCT